MAFILSGRMFADLISQSVALGYELLGLQPVFTEH